jgi:hypothetical protein
LQEAATRVKSLDRNELLKEAEKERDLKENKDNKVFLITTYNPNYHQLKEVVFSNWEMLGKSPATNFLYNRKLMCGYRKPKSLNQFLIRAAIPQIEGDDKARPNYVKPEPLEETQVHEPQANAPIGPQTNREAPNKGLKQKSIRDYMVQQPEKAMDRPTTPSLPSTSKVEGTNPAKLRANTSLTPAAGRGFNFCNQKICRYCPNINKSGSIKSTVTGLQYQTMTNISCRSSNLIYCITCKRCSKQYVGQTSLRLKSRFVHHYYTVDKCDQTKPVGKHFSQLDHNGTRDMDIHVLEFIKMPPKSQAALTVRNRVERRWIHLLRTPAPKGLNIDDL